MINRLLIVADQKKRQKLLTAHFVQVRDIKPASGPQMSQEAEEDEEEEEEGWSGEEDGVIKCKCGRVRFYKLNVRT